MPINYSNVASTRLCNKCATSCSNNKLNRLRAMSGSNNKHRLSATLQPQA